MAEAGGDERRSLRKSLWPMHPDETKGCFVCGPSPREKVQIMVEGGYDGSGKNIGHYSELADKKMGK